jgi:hypothetical protein
MSKSSLTIGASTLVAVSLLLAPGSALANDSAEVGSAAISPAQQALKDLAPIKKTRGYLNLRDYVRVLAGKRRATESQKRTYRGQLNSRRTAAGREVSKRKNIRRAAARETNRQGLNRAMRRAFRPYQLEINQIKASIQGEIIVVQNQFRTEARAVKQEWQPRVRRAQKEARKKIRRAKRYIAGRALKRYKKKVRRGVQRVIRARENYISTEIWPVYKNEINQLKIQRQIEILDVNREFNAEVRPGVNQRWDKKFSDEELPRLQKIVDSENNELNNLLSRGRKLIDAL